MIRLLSGVTLAVALAGCGPSPEEEAARDFRVESRIKVDDARDAVRSQLRDPESAQFDQEVLRKAGDVEVLCGTVNAKNAFGGYVGARPFMAAGGNAVIIDDANATADALATHRRLCVDSEAIFQP